MRILYGVVGEGMGHATRSRVVLEHLLARGHQIKVVVSGRAHGFLKSRFEGRGDIAFEEINGLVMRFEGNSLDKSQTLKANLGALPRGIRKNIGVYRKVAEEGFAPQMVVSDFESWAFLYGLNHRLPVISIDNMQIINRCAHDEAMVDEDKYAKLARWFVKAKMPRAYHYLVSSFFFPRVRKRRTSLVPPILREEVLAANRDPGEHVLVYQTAASNEDLVGTLQGLDKWKFKVYGMGREGYEGNVTLCPFSETQFVEDLRTARGVIAGGGYSLMGEAVHLRVPMLSVPLSKQFEQILNARYLAQLGYGEWAEDLGAETIAHFLENCAGYGETLARDYTPRDNHMLFALVDELIEDIAADRPAPDVLAGPSMGSFV